MLRCSLPLNQCRGQACDGASNMAGRLNGVAARLKKEEPKAHYVHCLAHSLNLCLQECGGKCSPIKDALFLTGELANLIRASPKRLALFNQLRSEVAPSAPGIKPLCPTRWTVRTSAIDSILKNCLVIDAELDQISEESCGNTAGKASGLRAVMAKFSTFFGLKLSFLIFSITEQLSVTLQGSNRNVQEASSAAIVARTFLERQRSDSAFLSFYQSVLKEAQPVTDGPVLPRRRRQPAREIDTGTPSYYPSSTEAYFRQQYLKSWIF